MRRRLQRKALAVALLLLASAGAGFGTYAVLFTQVLLPAGLVPVEVERTVRRADLLRELGRKGTRPVLVFGSSVVLEGVDAEVIEEVVPGDVSVYNIAESSAGLRNLMMNMPLIIAARPRVLVCCVRRSQLHADYRRELPNELLIGYAYARYVDTGRRQPAWIYQRLSKREQDALPGTAVTKLLASRVFLLRAIEERLRNRARPDLRSEGFASNFRDPWRYTRTIPPDRMAMFVERSRRGFADLRFEPQAQIADVLKACLVQSTKAGIRFLLVITPDHPLIQAVLPPGALETFDAGVRAVIAAHGAQTFVMNTGLFTSNDFLDHLHVNASGRRIFSRTLGNALADLLKN